MGGAAGEAGSGHEPSCNMKVVFLISVFTSHNIPMHGLYSVGEVPWKVVDLKPVTLFFHHSITCMEFLFLFF